ncbi:MAG: hypothetical protein R2830_15375 [Saprospiraceae bacterium]
MSRFVEKIATAKLDSTYVKLLNQIEKVPPLILDGFGPRGRSQRGRPS